MLDKQKVMRELQKTVPTLFKENTNERAVAQALFSYLRSNLEAQELVQTQESSVTIPSWQGTIDSIIQVTPHEHPYAVVAVDGSQIYPDRHQGVSCYLLNSGVAHFIYGEQSSVRLFQHHS